jgi:predicted metal-dependent hydrolase
MEGCGRSKGKMTEHLKIDEHTVEVRRRAYQRTLRLRVLADGGLRVTCARAVRQREIFAFVRASRPFLKEQFRRLALQQQKFPGKLFVDGESLPFLGELRPLLLRPEPIKPKLLLENRHFVLLGEDLNFEDRRDAVQRFYRRAGRHYLLHRLSFIGEAMRLIPK